jgi:tetratricopeptide (TPR) repeat protein
MRTERQKRLRNWGACLLLTFAAGAAFARLDTQRYGELREAERYQMDVAEKLANERKWESAQAEYEKFINLYLKSASAPYAQYMIAACCESRNLINQAIKEYKAVVSYFPESPEAPYAAFAIGRCHSKCGEPELAVQQYVAVMNQFPKEPVAGDALWEASEIQLQRDLYDKAFELRRRLVDSSPKSARFNQAVDWLVDHYLFRADDLDAARAVGKLRRSGAEAERYLAQRRYDRGHWLFNNQSKKDEGRKAMDKAVELFEGIIEQFPKDKRHVKDAMGMVAQCYRFSGRAEKAFENYERLLQAFPDDDDWRQHYANCLEDNGKWSEARLQFMRFKNKTRGSMQIAESYFRQRNVPEAEAAFMKVVAEFPEQAKHALYRIGNLHQHHSGNYEKAINAYRQSEYSPPDYLFRIAECHEAWKKFDLALKDYQEIVGFFKAQAPEAMWRSGLCYERRNQEGDKERAIATFKRVLDLYPGSGQSSQAHQRLEDKYKITYTGGGVKKEQ